MAVCEFASAFGFVLAFLPVFVVLIAFNVLNYEQDRAFMTYHLLKIVAGKSVYCIIQVCDVSAN